MNNSKNRVKRIKNIDPKILDNILAKFKTELRDNGNNLKAAFRMIKPTLLNYDSIRHLLVKHGDIIPTPRNRKIKKTAVTSKIDMKDFISIYFKPVPKMSPSVLRSYFIKNVKRISFVVYPALVENKAFDLKVGYELMFNDNAIKFVAHKGKGPDGKIFPKLSYNKLNKFYNISFPLNPLLPKSFYAKSLYKYDKGIFLIEKTK